jgi:hypothetical protein
MQKPTREVPLADCRHGIGDVVFVQGYKADDRKARENPCALGTKVRQHRKSVQPLR